MMARCGSLLIGGSRVCRVRLISALQRRGTFTQRAGAGLERGIASTGRADARGPGLQRRPGTVQIAADSRRIGRTIRRQGRFSQQFLEGQQVRIVIRAPITTCCNRHEQRDKNEKAAGKMHDGEIIRPAGQWKAPPLASRSRQIRCRVTVAPLVATITP